MYSILLFIEHKGSNGPASIGTVTSLATNTNSGTANAEIVDSAGDGTRRGRHCVEVMKLEITKVVNEGTTSQWCSLYPFPVKIITGPECMDHLTQLRVQLHLHHRDPPLLHPISQWQYERAPPFVILTHMML